MCEIRSIALSHISAQFGVGPRGKPVSVCIEIDDLMLATVIDKCSIYHVHSTSIRPDKLNDCELTLSQIQ